jgi:hypothetical protein
MALGTHDDYTLPGGARADMVVVSPEFRAGAVLSRARKAHPGAAVFAYLNTMDVMLSRAPEKASFWKKREDWFLHDRSGERVQVRVKNYKGPRARFGMNVGHPGYQNYLGRRAVEFLEAGFDGVQLDNVETDYSYRLRNVGTWISALPVEMTEERWYKSEIEMLARIRQMADHAGFEKREIIFNHMRAGELERSMKYLFQVDGANAEHWLNRKAAPGGKWGWESRLELAWRAGHTGKRTNLLATATVLSPEEALFTFASYLLALQGGKNTFWYGSTYRAEEMRWFYFYDTDIGMPVEETHPMGESGVYRREFEGGTVLVNPQESERRVDLDGKYLDEAFDPVREIELLPKEGKILLRTPGPPPERIVLEAESCLGGRPDETALRRKAAAHFSGGAAVEFGDTRKLCRLDAEAGPGRYRVVVEGRGQGKGADAAFVRVGSERQRVAFGYGPRQVLHVELEKPLHGIDLQAAEAGVILDRVILIRMDGP